MNGEGSAKDEPPQAVLRGPPAPLTDKVHRLGKGRPSGYERGGERGDDLDAPTMSQVVAIKDGDQRPGVDQRHRRVFLFRRSKRVKARPV
jgi:hypothetical protein